jgi:hypothetical protein
VSQAFTATQTAIASIIMATRRTFTQTATANIIVPNTQTGRSPLHFAANRIPYFVKEGVVPASSVVYPREYPMSVTETISIQLDAGQTLAPGQAPTAVSATLTNLRTDQVRVLDTPSVEGTVVVVPINGPTMLTLGRNFRLTVNFTASPSPNVFCMQLLIPVTV